MIALPDWNTVITIHGREYRTASRLLRPLGPIAPTPYYNVAVMRVDDDRRFIDRLVEIARTRPLLLDTVSRVAPLGHVFNFTTIAEFEENARDIALGWAPLLAGHSFFVRLHRRGLKGELSSSQEERFLDEALLAALAAEGTPGRIDFEDPDIVIDVEIIDHRAGLALWTRADLGRCPLLRLR